MNKGNIMDKDNEKYVSENNPLILTLEEVKVDKHILYSNMESIALQIHNNIMSVLKKQEEECKLDILNWNICFDYMQPSKVQKKIAMVMDDQFLSPQTSGFNIFQSLCMQKYPSQDKCHIIYDLTTTADESDSCTSSISYFSFGTSSFVIKYKYNPRRAIFMNKGTIMNKDNEKYFFENYPLILTLEEDRVDKQKILNNYVKSIALQIHKIMSHLKKQEKEGKLDVLNWNVCFDCMRLSKVQKKIAMVMDNQFLSTQTSGFGIFLNLCLQKYPSQGKCHIILDHTTTTDESDSCASSISCFSFNTSPFVIKYKYNPRRAIFMNKGTIMNKDDEKYFFENYPLILTLEEDKVDKQKILNNYVESIALQIHKIESLLKHIILDHTTTADESYSCASSISCFSFNTFCKASTSLWNFNFKKLKYLSSTKMPLMIDYGSSSDCRKILNKTTTIRSQVFHFLLESKLKWFMFHYSYNNIKGILFLQVYEDQNMNPFNIHESDAHVHTSVPLDSNSYEEPLQLFSLYYMKAEQTDLSTAMIKIFHSIANDLRETTSSGEDKIFQLVASTFSSKSLKCQDLLLVHPKAKLALHTVCQTSSNYILHILSNASMLCTVGHYFLSAYLVVGLLLIVLYIYFYIMNILICATLFKDATKLMIFNHFLPPKYKLKEHNTIMSAKSSEIFLFNKNIKKQLFDTPCQYSFLVNNCDLGVLYYFFLSNNNGASQVGKVYNEAYWGSMIAAVWFFSVNTSSMLSAIWLSTLHLILSNDVERNPGPVSVRSRPEIGDLFTIPDIDKAWREIGTHLAVDEATLNKISFKYSNAARCKKEMFRAAMKKQIVWQHVLDILCRLGYRSSVHKICDVLDIQYNGMSRHSSSESTPTPISPSSISMESYQPAERLKVSPPDNPVTRPRQSTFNSLSMASMDDSSSSAQSSLIALGTSSATNSPTDIAIMESSSSSMSASLPTKSPGKITFQRFRSRMLTELADDAIMVANKAYSINLISRTNLYSIRELPSTEKMLLVISLLEDSIKYDKQFEIFVGAIKTITVHADLADSMTRSYQFQLIHHMLQRVSKSTIDLSLLCHKLSDRNLICDDIKYQALNSPSPEALCMVLWKDLDSKGLGDQFLNFVESFENTRHLNLQRKLKRMDSLRQAEGSPRLASQRSYGEEVQEKTPASVGAEENSDAFLSAKEYSAGMDEFAEVKGFEKDALPVSVSSMATTSASYGHSTTLEAERSETEVSRRPGIGEMKMAPPQPILPVLTPHEQRMKEERMKLLELSEDRYVKAVKGWNIQVVTSVLAQGIVDVDYRFEKSRTALMLSAIANQKEMLVLLLSYKASVQATDVKGYTPLYLAAKYGNYELVCILIKESGSNVRHKSKAGVPLLVRTAEKGFSVITECLLEHGATVDAASEVDGMTPLYAACKNSHIDVVKLLVSYNADVTRRNPVTGLTPLQEALEGDDPEIVRVLMKAEAAARIKSTKLFSAKTPEAIKDLVIRGNAKIDIRDSNGATPLIVHSMSGSTDLVKKLIQLKANTDLQDNLGYSALIMACKAGHLQIVQVLVGGGAILDLKEKEHGYTGLMFAITNAHVQVVKELVLAKANIHLRNRDGKSALDLAQESKQPEIMEVMKVQSSGITSDDPFVRLLSGYMNSKSAKPKLSGSAATALKSKRGSPTTKETGGLKHSKTAVPDEYSSIKAELDKSYKRIADLEVRVQDLTTSSNIDGSKDEDVSYMDRHRLEAEFKKNREAKKKAEQYAVEAKQTAQRLSSENFKLREDLNKERHYNELTRKSIVKEVEQQVELNAKREKLEQVRRSVFQEEVAERAYQLVQNSEQVGLIYEKVSLPSNKLKNFIMKGSIRMTIFHMLVNGIPYSGKTTLCHKMGLATAHQAANFTLGLDLYEALLSRVSFAKTDFKPQHCWLDQSKLHGDMSASSLLHFLVENHQLPKFDSTNAPECVFSDPQVQQYFEKTTNSLQKISAQFANDKSVEQFFTNKFSLVNVYNIGENKAIRQFLQSISGEHPNVLLLDLLNINKYDEKTLQECDKNECGSALHRLVTCIQEVSYEKPPLTNSIVIGTHADLIKSDEELQRRKNGIMKLVRSYASGMGMPDSIVFPEMIAINVNDPEQCKVVTNTIEKLVEHNKKKFEVEVPLRFIFFRWYLHDLKLVFISRSTLIERAKACEIDECKIDSFLKLFRDCGSIISGRNKSDFLYNYFILRPVEFLVGLSKLYSVLEDNTIPRDYLQDVKYGIVSKQILKSLWQGPADGTSMSLSSFYISVLNNFQLCYEVADEYYIPSLKVDYDSHTPTGDSSSLIITTNLKCIPSQKQYDFVKYFSSREILKDKFKLMKSSTCSHYFNTTYFAERDSAKATPAVTIRCCQTFIEVAVSRDTSMKSSELYSLLKTSIVEIMKNVGNCIPKFRYELNIVCPGSKLKQPPHFIPFDVMCFSLDSIKCVDPSCSVKLDQKKHASKVLWIQAAYMGTFFSAFQPDDILTSDNLVKICKKLMDVSNSSTLLTISRELSDINKKLSSSHMSINIANSSKMSMKDVLFHTLYTWHILNTFATKSHLARQLKDMGYFVEAVALDPRLYHEPKDKELTTKISSKDIMAIADWWPSGTKELSDILSVKLSKSTSSKSNDVETSIELLTLWSKTTDGDQKKKLCDLFEKAEYFNVSELFI